MLENQFKYGYVTGLLVSSEGDSSDEGRFPDVIPANVKVTFTRTRGQYKQPLDAPINGVKSMLVNSKQVIAGVTPDGYLTGDVDPLRAMPLSDAQRGIWLVIGTYKVSINNFLPDFEIEVTEEHTESSPLDLADLIGYKAPTGSVIQTLKLPAGQYPGQILQFDPTTTDGLTWTTASINEIDALLKQQSDMIMGVAKPTIVNNTIEIDMSKSLNLISGLPNTTSTISVVFKNVTLADGRTNPDGLGTLVRIDSNAKALKWPGGTVVSGTTPSGPVLASIYRISNSPHVLWINQGSASKAVYKSLDDLFSAAEMFYNGIPVGDHIYTTDLIGNIAEFVRYNNYTPLSFVSGSLGWSLWSHGDISIIYTNTIDGFSLEERFVFYNNRIKIENGAIIDYIDNKTLIEAGGGIYLCDLNQNNTQLLYRMFGANLWANLGGGPTPQPVYKGVPFYPLYVAVEDIIDLFKTNTTADMVRTTTYSSSGSFRKGVINLEFEYPQYVYDGDPNTASMTPTIVNKMEILSKAQMDAIKSDSSIMEVRGLYNV